MKKTTLIATIALFSVGLAATEVSAPANAATSGCFTYTVIGGAASITDGTACSGALIIPSTLDSHPVTDIAANAFIHDRDITSVSLPNSVISLGATAFQDATALQSVSLGSGITDISQGAFVDNPALRRVYLPPTLLTIDGWAFFNCPQLEEITIPQSVLVIDHDAFGSDSALKNVTLMPEGHLSYVGDNAFSGDPLLNFGLPTRQGYDFAGFNTASDGSGTAYLGGALNSILAGAGPALYAQWAAKGHTVTYMANGATSGTAPVDFNSPYLGGDTVTVRDNPGMLAKTGYAFDGWNTEPDGSGAGFVGTGLETFDMIDGPVVLYAQWLQLRVKAVAVINPSISGTAKSSANGANKLTVNLGTWTGTPSPTVTVQWYVCSANQSAVSSTVGKACTKIVRATSQTLALGKSFKNKYVAVAVTANVAGAGKTVVFTKSTGKIK